MSAAQTYHLELVKQYRDWVRSSFYNRPPLDDDAFFHFLEERYEQGKQKLNRMLTEGPTEEEIAHLVQKGYQTEEARKDLVRSARISPYICACGLLTYGRLEVAMDIPEGIEPGYGIVRRLAYVLRLLLGMPSYIDPLKYPDDARKWLTRNMPWLKWNENTLRYERIPNPAGEEKVDPTEYLHLSLRQKRGRPRR